MTHDSGIYRITNKVNGRIYIGSAVDIAQRKHAHFGALGRGTHHNRHLQNAWLKYGADAFEMRVLLICSPSDLLFYEQLCLDAFAAVDRGYNKAPVAGNCRGRVLSSEARANIAAAKRGKPQSQEVATKRVAIMRSPEMRAKMSLAKKGKPHSKPVSDAHRAALSAWQKGKVISLETRAKIAAKIRGTKKGPHSEETKRKISAAQKGRPLTLEHRAKLCIAQQRRFARERAERAEAVA